MSDMPVPEPTERDEELALAFLRTKAETGLRGRPDGDQRCGTCHFYADPDRDIAFCRHDRLRIMVGGAWSCDGWAAIGDPDDPEQPEDQRTATRLRSKLVEDQQWRDHPRSSEQCNVCLYYLDPDASVSYCWNPRLRVGVGFDHWCQWWEKNLGEG